MKVHRLFSLTLIPSLALATAAEAQNLTDLDLATLMSMDVTVTSATKRAQASSDSAAAVYVVTRDDIRRSGATSLPDILRTVPGVQVARINSRAWAVTARGFNSRFAAKLLVMIDGRSIYTPLFSGVIWEEQSPFIDEIERIEVVRGPGGAVWGINAVNGVVNIITREAGHARGLELQAAAGSFEQHLAAMNFGAASDWLGDYRLFVEHSEADPLEPYGRSLDHTHVGMRLDRSLAGGALMLQGGLEESDLGSAPALPAASLPTRSRSGNASAAWERKLEAGQLELNSYYSWTDREDRGGWDESSFSFDTQLNLDRGGRHLVTLGAGFRYFADELEQMSAELRLADTKVVQHQWSFYAQDEIHFFADRVRLILGAKLEELEFTGTAFQPTVRGLWQVSDAHTLWAAASHAARTPSRVELHGELTSGAYTPDGLLLVRMHGNDGLEAEDLRAYEIGWRWRAAQTLSFDLAVYRNEYENLIGANPLPPTFELTPEPAVVLPAMTVNVDEARVSGAELVAEWRATEWLSFEGQGTWLDSGAEGVIFPGSIDPKRIFSARARLDLPRDVELDLAWRSVSDLEGFALPGYEAYDIRAGWRATRSVEVSLTVENVLDEKHVEFIDELGMLPGTPLGRMVFGRINWRPSF